MCDKVIVIKRVCYWCKHRQIDQWNATESSEIEPDICGYMINNQDKTKYNGKKDSF